MAARVIGCRGWDNLRGIKVAELSIVYVVINPVMPGLVKIGQTTQADAQGRLAQLYGSGVPFPFNLEFACRVANPIEVERALHLAFAPQRVNPKREFFQIDPAQAIAILRLLHTEDATGELQAQVPLAEQQEVVAGEQFRSRRPNLNFEEMGIPIGAVLASTSRPRTNIRVTRGHFTWPRHCTMATRGSSTPATGHYAALQHISAMGQNGPGHG